MRLNELPQRLVTVQIRVIFMVLQVPSVQRSNQQINCLSYLNTRFSYEWKYYVCTLEVRDWTAYVTTSFLNLRISQTIRQKLGFNKLVFCAKRLEIPLPLPHSHPLPPPSDCVLTVKDISDLSISTPSPSSHSIMWGYVAYICLTTKILVRNKKQITPCYDIGL
jgi:hypothetical protein